MENVKRAGWYGVDLTVGWRIRRVQRLQGVGYYFSIRNPNIQFPLSQSSFMSKLVPHPQLLVAPGMPVTLNWLPISSMV